MLLKRNYFTVNLIKQIYLLKNHFKNRRMKNKYLVFLKKGKWFLLAIFLASFFSNAFVKLFGLRDTALNTTLVVLGLMIIPTIIFIIQNAQREDKA